VNKGPGAVDFDLTFSGAPPSVRLSRWQGYR
jgi:hypothetical protein